jgi:hypothetical protein
MQLYIMLWSMLYYAMAMFDDPIVHRSHVAHVDLHRNVHDDLVDRLVIYASLQLAIDHDIRVQM